MRRPREPWEWDLFAALVVSMLDEHVGPTSCMADALGVRYAVWWNCFRCGWYGKTSFAFEACRPVLPAWQAGRLAREIAGLT